MSVLRNALILALSALLFSVSTQNAHTQCDDQFLILNGGEFGQESDGTLGSYDPIENTYLHIDSFPAQSATDMVVEDDHAYVLADSLLMVYDLVTNEQLEIRYDFHGAVAIEAYEDELIVTRRAPADQLVQLYSKDDLTHIHDFETIDIEPSGILIHEDYAYVALPGGWMSDEGSLAKIDLNNRSVEDVFDFGETGEGISDIVEYNDVLYLPTFQGKVIWFNTTDETWDYVDLGDGNGVMHTTGVLDNYLYAQMGLNIGNFDLDQNSAGDLSFIEKSFVSSALNAENETFLFGQTDYSAGDNTLYQYDINGVVVDSVTDLDIIPEVIAVHNRDWTPATEISGPDTVTATSGNHHYETPYSEGNSYEWSVSGGTITDETDNEVTVEWGEEGQGEVSVTETYQGSDCYATYEKTVHIQDDLNSISKAENEIFDFYPNPASDRIQIENTGNTGSITVNIYTQDGRNVLEQRFSGNNQHELDVSNLEQGLYLIEIQSDEGQIRENFMVN